MENSNSLLRTLAVHTGIVLVLAGLTSGALYVVADFATRGVIA